MRKEFASKLESMAVHNERIIFLTGDLGFMALEGLRSSMGERFINVGVSEQNMISMAASLAYENLIPVCYSIAPFIVFRPAEQIRIDVCLHNLNVKLVGNGGGFGYGIMGSTHHAIEDIAVAGAFQNLECFIPFCNEDVSESVEAMLIREGPCYLRLGYGPKPARLEVPHFSHTRKIRSGNQITVIGMGPVVIGLLKAIEEMAEDLADVFVISTIPLKALHTELLISFRKTKRILVIEEHVRHGGLGEHIASLILEEGLTCRYRSLHVKGYPNGLYGDQGYHLAVNGLDEISIKHEINTLLND